MAHPRYIACQDCDLLQEKVALPDGGAAVCARCGAVLYTFKRNSLERTLALSLAGAILFVVANTFPFLAFEMQGQVTATTLSSGIHDLYRQGMWGLAALVFVTTILVPLLELGGMLYVLVPLRFNRRPRHLAAVFRAIHRVQPWGMMEVFMLGILVSVVKLGAMANIVPGVALWAFAIMVFVVAAASSSLDPELVWRELDASEGAALNE